MPDDFHLSSFLPYRLAVLSERVSRRLTVEYERTHGLAVADWRVLVHLQRAGVASVRDIQTYVNLEKPRVSRSVAKLEGQGLVTKAQGQEDARLVSITLTDAGRAALAEIIPAAREIEQRLLNVASPDDLSTFFRVMEKMHQELDSDPKARKRASMDLDGVVV